MSNSHLTEMPLMELLSEAMASENKDPAFMSVLMSQVQELEVRLRDQQDTIAGLQKDVMTDPLTGIYNRRMFEIELNRALSAANRYGRQGSLLMVDLDGFKSINDSLGHVVGDQVICHVAKLIGQNIRPTDIVARLGGDEFAVLLTDIRDSADASARARALTQIIESTPCICSGGMSVHASASVGDYTFGSNEKMADVLKKADEAMYEVKNSRT